MNNVIVVSMLMTDVTSDTRKELHRGLAGRPRKIFRDPLAPYVGCKCGVCPRCLDNAKWNRRFEKFVDPTYYSRSVETLMRSPLSEF
jgi:hypothetical protein